MKKSVEQALIEASDALEFLVENTPTLSMEEKVDVAARLKAVRSNCESVDDAVKDDIKKRRRGKEGTVLGEIFKAVMQVIPTEKFMSKSLKEADPKTYAKYVLTDDVQRITFEAR